MANTTDQLTFKQLYEAAKAQPSPATAFVNDVAALTHRTEITVRKWLSGQIVPDMNIQVVLELHFKTPKEVLFPTAKTNEV